MDELESLELKISKFLRFGVILAGALILLGWVLNFKGGTTPFAAFEIYQQIPFQDLLSHYINEKNWGGLIALGGLISLISLPIIRVLLTAGLFIKQKEYALALIASLVLLGLTTGFFLGVEH